MRLSSEEPTNPVILLVSTIAAMIAFAANSVLTRAAFQETSIDPATFSFLRLLSGALTLIFILLVQRKFPYGLRSSWASAFLLFLYAISFTYSYRHLSTAVGALILFVFAQFTMLAYSFFKGERIHWAALTLTLVALVAFLLPRSVSPPFIPALMMVVAGVAWGGFSLVGSKGSDPIRSTASSFLWATIPAAIGTGFIDRDFSLSIPGVFYALLSGIVTSALGYVVWYWVRVRIAAAYAGTVQMSVPVISAIFGSVFFDERLPISSWLAACLVLCGVGISTYCSLPRNARSRR